MGEQTQRLNRRARIRAETIAEIKTIALKLMSTGGPDAISLRAIAREMGMTASAIYGYFPTRDDLITTLISGVYTSLIEQIEAAHNAVPAADTVGRLLSWSEAFRDWALANPEGFRLIYGDPVPGYQAPEGGPAPDAALRACTGLAGLAAAAWPHADPAHWGGDYTWRDFDPHLVTMTQDRFPGSPPGVLALALRLWGRMHGLVALEIYGHLRASTSEPARLYRDEMLGLVRSLGLDPGVARVAQ